jgi:hypothetical protein
MMFKVMDAVLLATLTLNYWPLAFVTVPLAIIWADRAHKRAVEKRRVIGIYEADRDDKARRKLFRSI